MKRVLWLTITPLPAFCPSRLHHERTFPVTAPWLEAVWLALHTPGRYSKLRGMLKEDWYAPHRSETGLLCLLPILKSLIAYQFPCDKSDYSDHVSCAAATLPKTTTAVYAYKHVEDEQRCGSELVAHGMRPTVSRVPARWVVPRPLCTVANNAASARVPADNDDQSISWTNLSSFRQSYILLSYLSAEVRLKVMCPWEQAAPQYILNTTSSLLLPNP